MKTKKRVLPALLLSLFAGATAPSASAQLAHFSGVYVFGDSLSDAGYFRPFLAGVGLPASLVSQMGRFTTNPGPVWSESVSQFYGVTPAPSNVSGGNIFAQGGARVAQSPGVSTPPGMPERPVSTQITEYLARGGGAADPNALYGIWAGANDVFYNLGALQAGAITQTQLQTNVLAAATAEIAQIGRLQAAGARYVMVFGLPDIGATPAFAAGDAATRGAVTALSAGYNTTLFSGLAGAGIRVIPVDTYSFGAEVRANAAAYGFTNTTGMACGPFPPITTAATITSLFCLVGTNVVPNGQNTYLYADSVHPTTAVQALIAQFAESLIEGPTAYSILPEAALHTRDGHIRTINDGLASGAQQQIGRITVFAAGDHGTFDVDPGAGNTNNSGSIGVTARVSEGATVGLAVGKTTSTGHFGTDLGGYKTNETVFSAFATMQWGGLYGTAIASISDLTFNDTSRNIVLGPVTRTATSRPEGSNSSFFATLGYDFPIGHFRVGPLVSVNSQNVTVNQFDEEGAGSANLRISGQTRRSEVWSVGAQASYAMGAWTPWIRITADKERRDDARFVTAMPLSLVATGNSYDIPAISLDTSFVTGAIGIRGTVMERIGLSLAYYKVSGRSGVKEDGVGGMLSYRF